MNVRLAGLALAAAATLVMGGCATATPDTTPTPSAPAPEQVLSENLRIYAAASLKASFDELVAEFLAVTPELTIEPVVYDGSSTLALQILEGAPADVFASADETTMDKVTDADATATPPTLFASNTLVLVVPAGNPAGIDDLADLTNPDLRLALCASEVPCGRASVALLAHAGLDVTADSLEQNVTAVLTKVASGEAEAGLVYRTDVVGNSLVEWSTPDGALDVVNRYPIATIRGSQNPAAAAAFVDFVLSPTGQAILQSHGFGLP